VLALMPATCLQCRQDGSRGEKFGSYLTDKSPEHFFIEGLCDRFRFSSGSVRPLRAFRNPHGSPQVGPESLSRKELKIRSGSSLAHEAIFNEDCLELLAEGLPVAQDRDHRSCPRPHSAH